MSKYTRAATNFKNRECLIEALKEAGYTAVEYHEKAVHLTGYRGDTRKETAEIVIPRNVVGGMGSASNDVGFKLNADGLYEAIISDFDTSLFTKSVMQRVKQGYTEGVTKRTMALKGLRFVGHSLTVTGNRVLEFAVI